MTISLKKIESCRERWVDQTPCFLLDLDVLVKKIETFQKLFDGEICYSFKTNPNEEIARTISKRGNTFTVCSLEELEILKKIVSDVSKVIYLSPTLDQKELDKVIELGVKRISIDSPSQVELAFINQQIINEVFLRVATGHKFSRKDFFYETESYLGVPIDEVIKQLEILSKTRFSLGIHNHLSSQNTNLESWRQNSQYLVDLVRKAFQKGIELHAINFGGGFPVQYDHQVPSLEQIANILSVYQRGMRKIYPDVRFVFEPGRYLVAEAIELITQVKQKKKFNNKTVLIVNTSAYNSSMDTILVGLRLPYTRLEQISQSETQNYVIRGRSPCSLDIIVKDANLPKTEVGDYILFLNAGAYNFSSDFVSMKKPETIII